MIGSCDEFSMHIVKVVVIARMVEKQKWIVHTLLSIIKPVVRPSRCNSMNFWQLHTGKDYYKYSFFPLAIVQWNALSEYVVVSRGRESFKSEVGELQHPKP